MFKKSNWAVENVRLSRIAPLAVVTATISFAIQPDNALAAGTTAGTTISNTATASYDNPNNPAGPQLTAPSNTVDVVVDEILDVTVVQANPGDVPVTPGSTNRVLAYTVTNTGNGSEAFNLTANGTIGGDQFNPSVTSIYLDNLTPGQGTVGVYDPGVDVLYVPGNNDPVLAPDASRRVFVLSTIPGGVNDADRGLVSLTAAATTGTGTPGTVFPGAGTSGSDAMVGQTGADGVDQAAYVVQSATVVLNKSAVVSNPTRPEYGTNPVPGSIITYTLVATVSGSGTLANLTIGDPLPANTTYQAGTLTLQAGALTDAADADAGEVASGAVTVRLGNLSAGTRTVTFKVKIN